MKMSETRKTNEEPATKNGRSSINNNIIIIRDTEPGVLSDEDAERILLAYTENVAERMTGAVAMFIEDKIRHGLTVDIIIKGCEITGFAQRPSPAYFKTVINNWFNEAREMDRNYGQGQWYQKQILKRR